MLWPPRGRQAPKASTCTPHTRGALARAQQPFWGSLLETHSSNPQISPHQKKPTSLSNVHFPKVDVEKAIKHLFNCCVEARSLDDCSNWAVAVHMSNVSIGLRGHIPRKCTAGPSTANHKVLHPRSEEKDRRKKSKAQRPIQSWLHPHGILDLPWPNRVSTEEPPEMSCFAFPLERAKRTTSKIGPNTSFRGKCNESLMALPNGTNNFVHPRYHWETSLF